MLRSRQARFKVEALDERLELRPADAERGPERLRQRSAARDLLWRALERIGYEHREILVLKELQGFRYNEIAKILDIPEGTVASRLFHARRALKDALDEMGAEFP
jgi:RNA polymerase sigma-70 factor (ECF subfamily)